MDTSDFESGIMHAETAVILCRSLMNHGLFKEQSNLVYCLEQVNQTLQRAMKCNATALQELSKEIDRLNAQNKSSCISFVVAINTLEALHAFISLQDAGSSHNEAHTTLQEPSSPQKEQMLERKPTHSELERALLSLSDADDDPASEASGSVEAVQNCGPLDNQLIPLDSGDEDTPLQVIPPNVKNVHNAPECSQITSPRKKQRKSKSFARWKISATSRNSMSEDGDDSSTENAVKKRRSYSGPREKKCVKYECPFEGCEVKKSTPSDVQYHTYECHISEGYAVLDPETNAMIIERNKVHVDEQYAEQLKLKLLNCFVCGAQLKHLASVRQHVEKHCGEPRKIHFKCRTCDFEVKQANLIYAHCLLDCNGAEYDAIIE